MRKTREEAIRILESESCYECTWGCESPAKCNCPKCDLKSAVKVAIEALEEQRPHGEWVEVGYTEDYHEAKYRCTNCKTEYKYTDFINIAPVECFPNFCPNCGSDNRKEPEP